ncbi:unnamed protein product [Caenorhabditis sp. 36 PRJEB53466]|nr:unnamed protein product [Caenorhabditis sp. 36 PRJEB53466]
MGGKLLLLLLIGVVLLNTADAARRRSKKEESVEEESCDEDDEDEDVGTQRQPNVGASRPKPNARKSQIQNDEGDGVEDPTDEDYLKYEDTNQEGLCILERGKCPQGDWRMFKRKNETVCLQVIGSPAKIDRITAGRVCRTHANARLMSIDNLQEREWLHTLGLVSNGSFGQLLIAGYRNRQCQMQPWDCKDRMKIFVPADGTANHEYLHSRWVAGPQNRYTYAELDDCLVIHTVYQPGDNLNAIQDWTCHDWHNTFLCGITVM